MDIPALKRILDAAYLANDAYVRPKTELESTGLAYDYGGSQLRIAYSGTNSLDDIPVDIGFWPNIRGEHSAIADRADKLLLPTQNIIDTYLSGRAANIALIGHSLGGGLAQIIAKRLKSKYPHIEAISFGSPRVFMLGATPAPKHIRVFHTKDPVPRVPVWPFVHKSTQELGVDKDAGWFVEVENHLISHYIESIQQRIRNGR